MSAQQPRDHFGGTVRCGARVFLRGWFEMFASEQFCECLGEVSFSVQGDAQVEPLNSRGVIELIEGHRADQLRDTGVDRTPGRSNPAVMNDSPAVRQPLAQRHVADTA